MEVYGWRLEWTIVVPPHPMPYERWSASLSKVWRLAHSATPPVLSIRLSDQLPRKNSWHFAEYCRGMADSTPPTLESELNWPSLLSRSKFVLPNEEGFHFRSLI